MSTSQVNKFPFGVCLAALVAMISHHAAAQEIPRLLPPEMNYRKLCAEADANRVVIRSDWAAWDGKTTNRSTQELLDIAREFLVGSDRVAESAPVAMKILDYVSANREANFGPLLFLYGRAYARKLGSVADLRTAERYFQKALAAGYSRAALALGQYYSTNGPLEDRDPVKARRYFQIAAASGDAEGQVALARLYSNDPTKTEAEKSFQALNALVSLVSAVKGGRCVYINHIGNLYLSGTLVEQDVDVAIKWYEKAAELGDALTAERIGRVLLSSLSHEVDYKRASDFFEQAADLGRPSAAFITGKAYAAGLGRSRDLDKAEKYLRIAADGGVGEALSWLARLYEGEFGGAVRDEKAAAARREAALADGAQAEEVVAYADSLTVGSSGDQLPTELVERLSQLAFLGSADAAMTLGGAYLKEARKDWGKYQLAEQFLRLAAQAGKSDGARELAKMYYCGSGVPLSVEAGNEWMERAAFLKSARALYQIALDTRGSSREGNLEASNRLMLKAVTAGSADAIGFMVARYEAGVDGFNQDTNAAKRMIAYVDGLEDETTREAIKLKILEERYAVASDGPVRRKILRQIGEMAGAGMIEAMNTRAVLLDDSGTATPDQVTAAYKAAADAGDARGMREYALRVQTTEGGETKAWLEKAAAAGDVYAQIVLADPLRTGSVEALDKLAQSGTVCSVDHMVALSRAYSSSTDTTAAGSAAAWLERAKVVVGKNADQLYAIANLLWSGALGAQRRAEAQEFFQRSADAGRSTALRQLAEGHISGVWADAHPLKGKAFLLRSAELGDLNAYGKLLEEIADRTLPSDYLEVEKLLTLADPARITGQLYLKLAKLSDAGGLGAERAAATLAWLTKSGESGNLDAMKRLVKLYQRGTEVDPSPEKMILWLTRAAEKGDAKSANELAAAYEVGFGVARDPVAAKRWRKQAVMVRP